MNHHSQDLLGLLDCSNAIGWVERTIKDVAPLQRGFDLPNSQLIAGKYPVCYSNGIKNYHHEFMVNGPGVWTGRSGTIGNVFFTEENYWPHNTALWVTDFKGNSRRFIYHLYSKLHFEKRMTGTGVPTLNRNDIHKFRVRIPDFQEQVEIANKIDNVEKSIKETESKIEGSKALQKSLINQIF
ncbi:MAG: restriction endonuclease subunit S [Bacteroidota bacterium]|nr:restriction endonuclease subunit S [Bacteroidota bacterium]